MPSLEDRRALKGRMPSTALSLVHTENCRVLPNRSELLRRLPHQSIGAEVGAAFGDFTAQIFQLNNPSKLYLIDSWETDRYRAGLEKIEETFEQSLRDGRLSIRQGLSTDVLETFDDGYFDWVYIDTDHSFDTTWQELQICDRKVARNGHIAGHDFCTGNVVKPVPYGVVEACTKFCSDYGWQFEFLTLESDGHFSFSLTRL